MVSGIGDAVASGIMVLFVIGVALGVALVGVCWALWHFVLSHVTLGWV